MAHDYGARPKSQGQVQSFLRLTPDVTIIKFDFNHHFYENIFFFRRRVHCE